MGIRTYDKQEKQAYIEDYKKSGEPLARYGKRSIKHRIETPSKILYNQDSLGFQCGVLSTAYILSNYLLQKIKKYDKT